METKKVKCVKAFVDDYIAVKQSQVNFINKYFGCKYYNHFNFNPKNRDCFVSSNIGELASLLNKNLKIRDFKLGGKIFSQEAYFKYNGYTFYQLTTNHEYTKMIEEIDKKDEPKTVFDCLGCDLPIKEGDEYKLLENGGSVCCECANLMPAGTILSTHIAKL